MRLTSRNIAIKRYYAGQALANYTERMWGYLDEGDRKKSDCARQKALMLSGLIDVLCRWRPTISEGYLNEYVYDVSSVTYPNPFVAEAPTFNGVVFSYVIKTLGDGSDVLDSVEGSGDCYISLNDDLVQVSYRKTGAEEIEVTYISEEEMESVVWNGIGGESGTVVITAIIDNEQFTSSIFEQCLSDEQVLNIVEKIDKLIKES